MTLTELMLRVDKTLAENAVTSDEVSAYKADLDKVELTVFEEAMRRLKAQR